MCQKRLAPGLNRVDDGHNPSALPLTRVADVTVCHDDVIEMLIENQVRKLFGD